MAVKNLYPNLPGHLVEFKDGGLQLTTNTTTAYGKSLLLLGTAFDGPVNEPVKIDETTVSQLFGSEVNENGYPNGSTLTKYAKQAFKNGFTDVRCMRVTGSQAYVNVLNTTDSSTENITDTIQVTVKGNAAKEFQLNNLPIMEVSVTTQAGTSVQTDAWSEYEGKIKINADVVSKNSRLNANYFYKEIGELETHNVSMIDSDVMTSVTLNFDSTTGNQGIYKTTKNDDGNYVTTMEPITDGIKVVLDNGTELVNDTDYKVVGNVLTFLRNDTTMAGGNATITYYVYTKTEASETLEFEDSDQTITLPKTPIDESVVLTVNGTTINTSNYKVEGDIITLIAGNFTVKDTVTISYQYAKTITTSETVTIRSIYGGSVYKTAVVNISETDDGNGNTGVKITFTKPESKKYSNADKPFYFTSFECPTIGTLKQALANYALNNVFEIVTDNEDIATANLTTGEYKLENGGDDGVVVTNDQMFEALSGKRDSNGYLIEQGAYQILENYNVDYIIPLGVYADSKQTVNPNSNFHYELALLCAVLTYRTKMTHGFIDVKPNSNTTLVGIQKHVNKLLQYNNIHYMKDAEGNDIVDKEGNKMDLGWYTSIVVGPDPVIVSDTLGTYYGSAAIAYAALNASLKPESAPTNKALPGVKGMKYKFSNKQMDSLVGNRMVVFKLKNEGTTTASSTPYVVDGCTAGAPNSDYARLSTVKVVTDVIDQIREVSDPFLGEPNTVEQRNAWLL